MPSSLTTLLPPALGFSPHPPVSVYGTGPYRTIAAFLGGRSALFATSVSLRITPPASCTRVFRMPHPVLAPGFPFPACASLPRPRSSAGTGCRNFHLLSIGYAPRPRLRPRLPQGRSALPWKPWIFGLEDSHLHLATHSGILSSILSTPPYRQRFFLNGLLLYHSSFDESLASVVCFSPGHFRRRTSRLVSCYALF